MLSPSASESGSITMTIAKAPENLESCACSRNAGYVEKKKTKMEV